ncbi:hypothetical protein, partial [Stenotrophomonas sp. P5_B8]
RLLRTTCRSNHSMTVSKQVALRRRHPVSARCQDKPRVATGQFKTKHIVKVVIEIGMYRIAGILQSDQTGQIRPVSELCWQLQTDRRHKQRCRFAASLTASGSRRRIAGCRAWLGTTNPTIRRSYDPAIRRSGDPAIRRFDDPPFRRLPFRRLPFRRLPFRRLPFRRVPLRDCRSPVPR